MVNPPRKLLKNRAKSARKEREVIRERENKKGA